MLITIVSGRRHKQGMMAAEAVAMWDNENSGIECKKK